jgi:hypothetical protein
MKRNPHLALVIVVLLVSSFFVSRHAAVIHANRLMTPAIENGWTHYNTRLQFLPGQGLVPGWRVGYELENSFTNPLAVYVDFRGRVDDWEVREVLARYNAEQNARGESEKPSESK